MTAEAPYPGLHPFGRDEADVFFGREKQTDQLLNKLDRHRFLAVVGPSGCGKSSLVRAGLIANLSAGLMVTAGARWRIALMRPGRHPMRRLSAALLDELAMRPERGHGPDAQGLLGAMLRRGPLGLVEALRETPPPPETNLLLLVDQFEEIFRFRTEKERDEADAFVALMLESAEQQEFPVYAVMTMRSDYIGDCGLFQGLPEHVSESQFLTPRLLRNERQAAITGPARVFGGDVEPALVNHLLNETSRDPDRLPVLQHLLMRMWDQACREREGATREVDEDSGPTLTFEHYEAVGGLTNALSNHANEAYGRLNEDQKRLGEIMFRRLCELGSDHMDTRRPTPVQEIAEVAGVAPELVMGMAHVFRTPDTNFIVPGISETLFPGTDLDISHESLIRQWDKLREWVRKEAELAKTYLRLAGDAEFWERGQAPLWRTPSLETAQKWQQDEKPNEAWSDRYGGNFDLAMRFLSLSEEAQDRERREKKAERLEKERILRERAEEQRLRADAERRRACEQEAAARKYRQVAVVAVIFFALAAVSSAWGWIRENEARTAKEQAKIAEFKAVKGQAKLVSTLSRLELENGNNRTAMRIPLEMFAQDPDRLESILGRSGSPESMDVLSEPENALFKALYRPIGTTLEDGTRLHAANFSGDGTFVVTAADDGTSRVWDVATGKTVGDPIKDRGQARWASFDSEGRRIVVAYSDASSPTGSTAKIWDPREKRIVATLTGHTAGVNMAAFSRDGGKIVTASSDNTARVWNAADGALIKKLSGHTQGVFSAAFDRDGARVVTASFDGTARIWDAATGQEMGQPRVHWSPVADAQFDGEGKYIVTASRDGKARVWNAEPCGTGYTACEPLRTLVGHRKDVTSAEFSRDGKYVLTAANDNTARIWDWEKGTTVVGLEGPSGVFGWISRAHFSPASDRILAMFGGTSAYIWDLEKFDKAKPVALRGHGAGLKFADFSVTGDRVVTASVDKTARVWNPSTGEQILQIEHDQPVLSAAFDSTGDRIVTAAGGTARIWKAGSGETIVSLPNSASTRGGIDGESGTRAKNGLLFSALFSPGGDRVVTASTDGTARVWDSGTGELRVVLGGHTGPVTHATFAPDGKRVVTSSVDGTARIWDAATGEVLRVISGHDVTVVSAAFDAAGTRIVTTSVDKTMRVWNADSGALLGTFKTEPEEAVGSASFSPDGRYLVVAGADGAARILDRASGDTLAVLRRHGGAIKWSGYDAGGRQIVTASEDGTAAVWKVPPDLASRIEYACGLLAPLSEEEEGRFGAACGTRKTAAR